VGDDAVPLRTIAMQLESWSKYTHASTVIAEPVDSSVALSGTDT